MFLSPAAFLPAPTANDEPISNVRAAAVQLTHTFYLWTKLLADKKCSFLLISPHPGHKAIQFNTIKVVFGG